jgi:hypothetical protein
MKDKGDVAISQSELPWVEVNDPKLHYPVLK